MKLCFSTTLRNGQLKDMPFYTRFFLLDSSKLDSHRPAVDLTWFITPDTGLLYLYRQYFINTKSMVYNHTRTTPKKTLNIIVTFLNYLLFLLVSLRKVKRVGQSSRSRCGLVARQMLVRCVRKESITGSGEEGARGRHERASCVAIHSPKLSLNRNPIFVIVLILSIKRRNCF